MNRGIACLLFSVVSFLGCGARTGTLDFGSGGPDGNGGTPNVGASAGSGATDGGFGASGGTPEGGSPSLAGFPSVGGAPGFAGFPSVGGAPSFAGFPSVGGAPSFAGFPSVGGFPSFGGAAGGSGGEGGPIVNACMALVHTACDNCLCTNCSLPILGCVLDGPCTRVFACVERSRCRGAGCYTNNTCRTVIDNNGGPNGAAVSQVLSIATCAAQSQSNCGCN